MSCTSEITQFTDRMRSYLAQQEKRCAVLAVLVAVVMMVVGFVAVTIWYQRAANKAYDDALLTALWTASHLQRGDKLVSWRYGTLPNGGLGVLQAEGGQNTVFKSAPCSHIVRIYHYTE